MNRFARVQGKKGHGRICRDGGRFFVCVTRKREGRREDERGSRGVEE